MALPDTTVSAPAPVGCDVALKEVTTMPYQFIDYRAAASPDDSNKRVPETIRKIVASLNTPQTIPGTDSAMKYRSLPTVLLYDDKGLDLFDQITYLREYYLTNCEIEVLRTNIGNIVSEISNDCDVIELGCGSLRKTQILLDALNAKRTGITYHAIDVMPQPLHDSMNNLAPKFSNLSFIALCGTYSEVLAHFKKSPRPKVLLWLGSSIGNCHMAEAAEFLHGISTQALVVNDAIIVGMDQQKDPQVIMDAYHDSKGITDKFEINALSHVNSIVAKHVVEQEGSAAVVEVDHFRYVGEYSRETGCHVSFLEALQDTQVKWPQEITSELELGDNSDIIIKRGERIYIESSYKYNGRHDAEVVSRSSGLTYAAGWKDSRHYYELNMFRKPKCTMVPPISECTSPAAIWHRTASQTVHTMLNPTNSAEQAAVVSTIPVLSEWKHMWDSWETLILRIIPTDKLLSKPIDLRHPFIFYLGHIPAFADIHLAAAESAPLTEPAIYAQWFERGIDPNMEDPSVCHSHSDIPTEWPSVENLLAYQLKVHERITNWLTAYEHASCRATIDAARHVWMVFEHYAMHFETLLYMVLQMEPSSISSPIKATFAPLPKSLSFSKLQQQWIDFTGQANVRFGLDGDDESALQGQPLTGNTHVFGWDNERPQMTMDVKPFGICTQPITNGQYLEFLKESDSIEALMPSSWIKLSSDGLVDTSSSRWNYGVRTVVGTPSINNTEAALWPVYVSQKQAIAYAEWCGKRLPTEAEWKYASRTYHLAHAVIPKLTAEKSIDTQLLSWLDAQPGVSEHSLDYYLQSPYDLHIPRDANVGLAHWHPAPVSSKDQGSCPEATFIGNGWELTSTPFYPYNGFNSSPMYPGYSSDFFDAAETIGLDSTHYVVLGGSYATHPRLAQRQTFRNWYQRGYPYVLATFRLCKDTEADE